MLFCLRSEGTAWQTNDDAYRSVDFILDPVSLRSYWKVYLIFQGVLIDKLITSGYKLIRGGGILYEMTLAKLDQ